MTHLDTDVLAEFRAGLITGRRGARIAAHLAGCARCTALDDQLAGVCSLLASVPVPAMPDSMAQRLDVMLAAEVAQRGMTQGDQAERAHGDGTGESPAPRRPGGGRGFRLLTQRVLAPAAAVVLLAAGGYGLSRIGLGSSTGSAASTTAGSAARAEPTAAASAQANAPTAGPVKRAVPRGITPAIVVRISHRHFSHAGFEQQVQAELRVPSGSLATQAASAQVRGCVQQVAGTNTVQRVESVRYDGRPATLIVARTGADDTAWIAASDCSATYGHVLDTTSLPSGISGP